VGVMTRASSILISLPGLRQMDPRAIPALRMIDALPARPHGTPEQIRHRQRRADALALLTESSVRSYPSWIAELRRKSPAGIDRRRYAYEHIRPGEALELVREAANQKNDHAVAYHHRGVHLGYVPRRHRWIARRWTTGFGSPQSPRRSRSDGFFATAPNSSAPASSFSMMVGSGSNPRRRCWRRACRSAVTAKLISV
jgi:HIRAN domain